MGVELLINIPPWTHDSLTEDSDDGDNWGSPCHGLTTVQAGVVLLQGAQSQNASLGVSIGVVLVGVELTTDISSSLLPFELDLWCWFLDRGSCEQFNASSSCINAKIHASMIKFMHPVHASILKFMHQVRVFLHFRRVQNLWAAIDYSIFSGNRKYYSRKNSFDKDQAGISRKRDC